MILCVSAFYQCNINLPAKVKNQLDHISCGYGTASQQSSGGATLYQGPLISKLSKTHTFTSGPLLPQFML